MKKISLIVGQSSSMPEELIKKYDLEMVPFPIDWPQMQEVEGKNLFEKMRNAEKNNVSNMPKTSQPSVGMFKKLFEKRLGESEQVLFISISSALSGTYNSAFQARKMLDAQSQERVFIFDCLSTDAVESLMTLEVIKLIEKDFSMEEILNELEIMKNKVKLIGFLEDPKWLESGGRMNSTLASLVRQMQKIGMRPLLGVKDGIVKPVSLKLKAKDIPTALLKEIESQTEKDKNYSISITHADSLENAQILKSLIEKNLENAKIKFINLTNPVIGVHIGPGSVLCSWIEN